MLNKALRPYFLQPRSHPAEQCAQRETFLQIEKCRAHHGAWRVRRGELVRRPEVFPHCQGQSMIALWCVRIPPDCSWQRRLAGPSRQSPDRCHGWRSSRDDSAGPVVCNDRQPATLAAQAMPCTATGRGKNGVLTNIPSSWIVQSATTEGTGFVSVLRTRLMVASAASIRA
jgi:hypothetical protein